MDREARISPEELLAHSAWMKRLALALAGDMSRADDLVEQTMTSWITHGKVRDQPIRPWLKRVMTNLARSTWRSDDRREEREILTARSEAQDAEDIAETLEMHELLMGAIKQLKPSQQAVIVRHYFEEESLAEIARSSGQPESTVRNRLNRAQEELRQKLDRHHGSRENWVALFVAFATRTKSTAALPAGTAASAGALGVLGWIALSMAVLLVGSSVGYWMWNESRPTLETLPGAFAATSSMPVEPANESSSPSTTDARIPVALGTGAAVEAPSVSARGAALAAVVVARLIDAPSHLPIQDGVSVVIDPSKDEGVESAELRRAKSSSDGRVNIEILPTDRAILEGTAGRPSDQWSVELVFSAAAHATLRVRSVLMTSGTTTPLGDVFLDPGGMIEGKIVTQDGSPIPQCRVYVMPLDLTTESGGKQAAISNAHSDIEVAVGSDGSYTLSGVPVGMCRIALSISEEARGEWRLLRTESVAVRVGETARVPDLVLEQRRDRISGILLAPDSTPVRGGRVAYIESRYGDTAGARWQSVTTDDRGRFVIGLDQPITCDLVACGDGIGSGDRLVQNVGSGTRDLVLRLPEPTWIEITVVDETSVPIHDFMTSSQWSDRIPALPADAGHHRDGKSRVLVHAKPFSISVSAAGRIQEARGPIDPLHHPDKMSITLLPMTSITGRVTGDGGPIPKAAVELHALLDPKPLFACNGFPTHLDGSRSSHPKHTAEDGRFVVPERERDKYVLIVRADGYATYESAPFDYDPATSVPELHVVLLHGGTLDGRVITESNVSTTGIVVGVSRGDGTCRTCRVKEDGTYRFEGLAAGRWSIRRCEKDFNAARENECRIVSGFAPSLEYFDVQDGRPTLFNLDLRGATCELEGRLGPWSCEGCALSAALTALPDLPGTKHETIAIASNGSFQFEANLLGLHSLVIAGKSADGRDRRITETLDLKLGTNSWTLDLATGTLEGNAQPNQRIQHTWKTSDETRDTTCTTTFFADAQGHYHISGIPAGMGEITFGPPKGGTSGLQVNVPKGGVFTVKPQ